MTTADPTDDTATPVAPVVGQRRTTPMGQVIVITDVDVVRRLVWGHRESDGYKVAKGEGVALRVVESWPLAREATVTMRYQDTPPSMNDHTSGHKNAHWAQGHKVKKRWHQIFDSLLQLYRSQMPREPVAQVRCYATLVFPRRTRGGNRRDPENYRYVLSKALGDALVDAGVIADDSGTAFHLVNITIETADRETPDRRETVVTIAWYEPA